MEEPALITADVIPLIRALWKRKTVTERTISVVVGIHPLKAKINQIGKDCWAWTVDFGKTPTGGYEGSEEKARGSAEDVIMSLLKKSNKAWKKAA